MYPTPLFLFATWQRHRAYSVPVFNFSASPSQPPTRKALSFILKVLPFHPCRPAPAFLLFLCLDFLMLLSGSRQQFNEL